MCNAISNTREIQPLPISRREHVFMVNNVNGVVKDIEESSIQTIGTGVAMESKEHSHISCSQTLTN